LERLDERDDSELLPVVADEAYLAGWDAFVDAKLANGSTPWS
jgi:hypothetical protein